MMNLNKDPESWRRVSVEAVMAGSRAQGENVLRMAIEDLLRLADAYERATQERNDSAFCIEEMQRFNAHVWRLRHNGIFR